MNRQQLAYLLMILMAVAIACALAYKWRHSHRQTYLRQRRKEAAEQDRRTAEGSETPPD